MYSRTCLCLTALVTMLASDALCQPPPKVSSISGVVKDEKTKEPIGDASVILVPATELDDGTEGRRRVTGRTDKDGRFTFANVAAGTYELRIYIESHTRHRQKLTAPVEDQPPNGRGLEVLVPPERQLIEIVSPA